MTEILMFPVAIVLIVVGWCAFFIVCGFLVETINAIGRALFKDV